MENHPMAGLVKASVLAVALTGLAACDNSSADGSGAEAEQTDILQGSQSNAPVAEEPASGTPPVN